MPNTEPVFLTQIDEYEKQQAAVKLLSELTRGEESAKENGWLSQADVEQVLGLCNA